MFAQLTRPAFRAFLDDKTSTIALIRDVADLLENIAAGPLHTPALYSTFLKALISVQTDEPAGGQISPRLGSSYGKPTNSGADGNGSLPNGSHAQNGSDAQSGGLNLLGTGFDSILSPPEFNLNSEMGPAADISTFPPTMVPTTHDDVSAMLSMDSILSNGFWDSVLVPGKFEIFIPMNSLMIILHHRLLQLFGGTERRLRIWGWRQWSNYTKIGHSLAIGFKYSNRETSYRPYF